MLVAGRIETTTPKSNLVTRVGMRTCGLDTVSAGASTYSTTDVPVSRAVQLLEKRLFDQPCEGFEPSQGFYPLFFNHFNNLSVDQQLITSSFNTPARLAMATP